MMEKILAYLSAISAIDDAERQLDAFRDEAPDISEALGDRWALVSVISIGEPFVPGIPWGEHRVIDGRKCFRAEEIARTLRAMHAAYDAAERAWQEMESHERERLAPPPGKLSNSLSSPRRPSAGDADKGSTGSLTPD